MKGIGMLRQLLRAINRQPLLQVAVLWLCYAGMGRWLASKDLLSVLLSPQGRSGTAVIAVAVIYLLLRMIVLLLIPGVIVQQLWLLLAPRYHGKFSGSCGSDSNG